MISVRQLSRLGQIVSRRSCHHYAEGRQPTLNMVPKPQGSWEEFNSKKQAGLNMYLAGSVIYLAVSAGFVIGNGFIEPVLPPPMTNEK